MRDDISKALDLLKNVSLFSYQEAATQKIVLKLENLVYEDILSTKKKTHLYQLFRKRFLIFLFI